jgi:hypothetical protein
MEIAVHGPMFEWRGPAPFTFVAFSVEDSATLAEFVTELSYGWGCIPAEVTIGATTWTTSLMPKDGAYLVPIKQMVRHAEGVHLGDVVTLTVHVAG